jgi:hypothetical protein
MELDQKFEGYKEWVEGTKQTVIGEPGDTVKDAIQFMHAHFELFELHGKFTFNAGHVVQEGNDFIFTIHKFGGNHRANRLRLGYGVQPDIDAWSKE